MHLLVDSTGLKLCGAGEWLVEKHSTRTRRSWRKLHLGVDADTGRIVASALTGHDADDGAQVGPLLDQVEGPWPRSPATVRTTRNGVYDSVAERHPEAAVVVPPRATAVPSEMAETEPTQRDRHLQHIADARPDGLAESVRVHEASPGRGRHREMEAGDRRRAALAHGRASGDRGGGRRPCPQPHAGAGTPELRPRRLTPDGVGVVAPTPLIHAPRLSTPKVGRRRY